MNLSNQQRVPFVDLREQYASIKHEIRQAVDAVLESAQFVGGQWVEKFEEEFAQFVGAKYAVGVGSGTAALELSLRSSGIQAGDDVVVPTNSFFATAEAVSNVGARPVFADVEARTFHLDLKSVERVITPRTRAIVTVHLYGRAMDLTELEEFAARRHLHIIEDAAQAHGVERRGARVGGSGRLTCFSFYPGKNLGAYGDGGAVTGNDPTQIQTVRLLRDHGSPAKYRHSLVGTNSRLDSLQAAVLSVKLHYLNRWNSLRVSHARTYAKALSGTSILPPEIPANGEHNFHLFVVRTKKREELKGFLDARGIGTGIHYPIPLHLTEAYQQLGYSGVGSFPVAEALASEILSVPMFPELSPAQIDTVIEAITDFETAKRD